MLEAGVVGGWRQSLALTGEREGRVRIFGQEKPYPLKTASWVIRR